MLPARKKPGAKMRQQAAANIFRVANLIKIAKAKKYFKKQNQKIKFKNKKGFMKNHEKRN